MISTKLTVLDSSGLLTTRLQREFVTLVNELIMAQITIWGQENYLKQWELRQLLQQRSYLNFLETGVFSEYVNIYSNVSPELIQILRENGTRKLSKKYRSLVYYEVQPDGLENVLVIQVQINPTLTLTWHMSPSPSQ